MEKVEERKRRELEAHKAAPRKAWSGFGHVAYVE
jgi:hypothetical protein